MIYFKFTNEAGEEFYGSINAEKEMISLEKLKRLLFAKTIEEMSQEEYDRQTKEGEGEDD